METIGTLAGMDLHERMRLVADDLTRDEDLAVDLRSSDLEQMFDERASNVGRRIVDGFRMLGIVEGS